MHNGTSKTTSAKLPGLFERILDEVFAENRLDLLDVSASDKKSQDFRNHVGLVLTERCCPRDGQIIHMQCVGIYRVEGIASCLGTLGNCRIDVMERARARVCVLGK